jgi:hypothetical protein
MTVFTGFMACGFAIGFLLGLIGGFVVAAVTAKAADARAR